MDCDGRIDYRVKKKRRKNLGQKYNRVEQMSIPNRIKH